MNFLKLNNTFKTPKFLNFSKHFLPSASRRFLNIHEHQAKEIMKSYNVCVQRGGLANTPEKAEEIGKQLMEEYGCKEIVLKAQILAGGRGKGVYEDGFKGGVHIINSSKQLKPTAKNMLHKRLITKQTDPVGETVDDLLVLESINISREIYVAILLDRQTRGPVIVVSKKGGVDIEESDQSDSMRRFYPDYLEGITRALADQIAVFLKFDEILSTSLRRQLRSLYRLFVTEHATQVEINPLAVTPNKSSPLVCIDAKLNIDDNAPPNKERMVPKIVGEIRPADPREAEAKKHGLSYIALDGTIGCMVNGAGLAMATMDMIQALGGSPANFLDVGGGATEEQVKAAFELIASDSQVDVILVNIFGGILRCDVLAKGIVNAAKSIDLKLPLVVRLEGTNVEAGRKILAESGLKIRTAVDMKSAAHMAVRLSKPLKK